MNLDDTVSPVVSSCSTAAMRGASAELQAEIKSIFFFFQAEDGIRYIGVTGVQTCALPISRSKLIEFAEKHQIPIAKDKRGEAPFSVDANLLHASSEGKVLEDPAQEVPDYVYSRTIDPEKAPDKPTYISMDFERGDAVAIDGKKLSPATLLAKLNELGRANGIGRLDLVENR